MSKPQPIEPAELLAHAGWMRALAGSLVADAASADDVVQESLVAALHRPPAPGRPLEAWLSRVVRNVASNFRRRESAQAQRRVHAGDKDGLTDPAEIIERLDTQRMIVELVRELHEPSRSTIVLRYFEGLSSEEIGRRMGVSDATVRWRLQKALDQLRSRLQRNFGSREAWCAVLAPLANFPITGTVAASSGAAAGAIVMGTASKLVAAAVAAVVLGTGIWFAVDRKEPTVRSAEIAAPESKEIPDLIAAPGASQVEREVLAAPPDQALPSSQLAIAAKSESAVDESSLAIRARFVDSAGRPWSEVGFSLQGVSLLSDKATGSTTCQADGVAELRFVLPETYSSDNFEFAATRTGCESLKLHASLARGRVVDLGDLVLQLEARILGMVHDARGVGLADVTVGLLTEEQYRPDVGGMRRQGPWRRDQLIVTKSSARGTFELRGVSAGKWRLWAHRDGLGYGYSDAFEVEADTEQAGMRIEVPALLTTDTISGRVLDPQGNPAADARVTFRWEVAFDSSGSTTAIAGADGNFEIVVNSESPGEVSAEDRDHRLTCVPQKNLAGGTRGIVLQLAERSPQTSARLRIHGPRNEPVRGATASVLEHSKTGGFGHPLTLSELEPGLYEFSVPRMRFSLTITADGFLPARFHELEPGSLAAELEVELVVAPMLSGRVTASGKPIAKAKIEALPPVPRGTGLIIGGFPSLMNPWVDVNATSNDEGSFTIKLQDDTVVYLRCEAAGFAPRVVGPIDVDSSSGLIEIALDVGGSIEGHVRAKDGSPVVGAIVGITCGDGHPQTKRSGQDGAFRFEGLTAGSWLVMESAAEVTDLITMTTSDTEFPTEWSCVVTSDKTTYHDLQLDH
ncbi:MAG TPA: sigma-70 family RNA polymerase sigma factor [Planctomycetota bacterium]|nr:sigma-70 family RNA polymerase sigma factor [Planctomycetota bacterium]